MERIPAAGPTAREEAERGYDNCGAVPDHGRWLAEWTARSKRAFDTLNPAIDLRFGAGDRETLDLFLPARPALGTLMFIHGGYWRGMDKADHAFVAPAFVAAGYAVALINYDLCPGVAIAKIVEQCRHAVRWLERYGAQHGAPAPLVISGHSAGGHLAAMLYATDWRPVGLARAPFTGVVTLSGLHDLAPLTMTSINADLRLDADEARRMSPVNYAPLADVPLAIAVGADETPEYLRQARLIHAAWSASRGTRIGTPVVIPDRHHFSVVLDYSDPDSALTRTTKALFAR